MQYNESLLLIYRENVVPRALKEMQIQKHAFKLREKISLLVLEAIERAEG